MPHSLESASGWHGAMTLVDLAEGFVNLFAKKSMFSYPVPNPAPPSAAGSLSLLAKSRKLGVVCSLYNIQ